MITAHHKQASTVTLHGITADQYKKVRDALDRRHGRHTFDQGTLEIDRELHGVSWSAYQKFLAALGDHSLHHAYDRGTLIMMPPRKDHEWIKRLIGRMIEACTLDQKIMIQSLSSTTIIHDRAEQGFQPDESYYITNEHKVRGKRSFDPHIDPPPDLIVEVDVTSDSRTHMALYSKLKIPEIWLYNEPELVFLRRQPRGRYLSIPRSVELPFIEPGDITKSIARLGDTDETTLIASFVRLARRMRKKRQAEQI